MFYFLGDQIAQHYSIFGLFKYLTFRMILATLTALSISIFFGPFFIKKLKDYQIKQNVRRDGPQSHLTGGRINSFFNINQHSALE